MTFHVPEKHRLTSGTLRSSQKDGNNGAFKFLFGRTSFFAIASDQDGWEHVSVTTQGRCPTWEEMCRVKSMFWDVDDCVVQYHPPKSEYVNNHPYCLHLWRPVNDNVPTPPSYMVGIKSK